MDEKPGDDTFERRLRAAREKQGLDVPASTAKGEPSGLDGAAWRIGVRVGVEMVTALVVAVAIGWALDRWLGTRPVFLGVFVLLGGAAGVLNVWRMFVPRR
ncbi:MAG TPA: AtpZ/AtpI family protein [Acetobacteraceae bacterium]|jgi:ATP synthase protein I|nr:AtpZ/AtpI family protein [Acetobacteraceae bacterium]